MIHILATEFIDLPNGSTFGYRIYNDYGKDYYNLLDSPIENDMKLLQLAKIENPEFFMTSDIRYLQVNINGNNYNYDSIKDYL